MFSDDLKSFYMTPVDTNTPFDALTKMELPKNMHVQENYVRFHPGNKTSIFFYILYYIYFCF